MRRLAWIPCAGLLLWASPALALYDGPGPVLSYDRTDNFRVVFTSQAKVLSGGRSHFKVTAYVPIVASTVGQNITLEVRKLAGDAVIGSCTDTAAASGVGSSVAFECDLYEAIPGTLTPGDLVDVYPFVVRAVPLLAAQRLSKPAPAPGCG